MKKILVSPFIAVSMALLALTILQPVTVMAQDAKVLYEQKCGRCHVAYSPNTFTADEWPGVVRSMKAQASLSEEEITALVDYLQRESRTQESQAHASGPQLNGYLYTEYFQTPERTKNFDIHYLALYVSGWAAKNIFYFGEFELEHGGVGGNNTFVEQAYLEYWFTSNLALKIGALLPPFNRFDDFHDPISNYLITRPQMSREIGVSAWKDVGVELHGFLKLNPGNTLNYHFYTINGLGNGANLRGSRQYRDNNENRAIGGRVSWIFNDLLEVGGSAYQGAWDPHDSLNVTMLGAHLLWTLPFADLYAEYAAATSENPHPLGKGEMSGYFVQISKLIQNRWRPVFRLGNLDYLDPGDQFGRNPAKGNQQVTEYSFGLSYYPTERVVFKLEYTIFKEGERLLEKDNNQLGLQAAVKF